MHITTIRAAALASSFLSSIALASPVFETETNKAVVKNKPRVILNTDFPPVNGIPGGEPGPANMKSDLDDIQTMVRFLSYSNDFQVEGLVAASGTFANYANKTHILDMLDRYAQVYPNLALHDSTYPTPDYLRSVTVQGYSGSWGQPARSILGAGKDSEASDFIISVVDKSDNPVWFLDGGGPRELGQAIWKVNATRSARDVAKFISKIRVYGIEKQDGSADWMMSNFPDLFYIDTFCYYGIGNSGPYDGNWLQQNVITGHGALGAAYPPAHWTYSQPGIFEGDSPDFLYVLNGVLGLSDINDPSLGGWGGRFVQNGTAKRWQCGDDGAQSISMWEDARNWDFAARMDWCVKPYSQANHNPVAVLNHDKSLNVVHINAKQGSTVNLSAQGSSDPDGNQLSYSWLQYPVTTPSAVQIASSSSMTASFTVPNAPGSTVYIVLEVKDNGTPALTSYRRLAVAIEK